ncbi:MAG: PilZ domain-containing protein [Bacteroidota bacterium]
MQSFFPLGLCKLRPVNGEPIQERRKLARKSLMSYSQVHDLYAGVLLGYLADLTLSGAMVIAPKPLEVGREITLQLEVPELQGFNVRKLTLPAHVVWCQPDVSPSFHNIGFEFRQVRVEQSEVILAIMERYEFRREMPRYPVRPAARR